jgi:hypothetical protein
MIELETPTQAELERHYSALLDSVAVINTSNDDAEIARNVEHLQIMLARDWWAGFDLAPVYAAIDSGE